MSATHTAERLSPWPTGTTQMRQCGFAVLEKGLVISCGLRLALSILVAMSYPNTQQD